MRLIEDLRPLILQSNVEIFLRERGKLVPGSRRVGHNVFTTTGRNLLSKLIAWQTIDTTDTPYTHRRARWIGVGNGTQLEVTTVAQLNSPLVATAGGDYIVPLQTVEFPTSSSVRLIKEFSTSEITVGGVPVTVTEAALFADVNPAIYAGGSPYQGTDDSAFGSGVDTVLNPQLSTNAPIAYKAFEGITKTVDFTLEIRWDLRF